MLNKESLEFAQIQLNYAIHTSLEDAQRRSVENCIDILTAALGGGGKMRTIKECCDVAVKHGFAIGQHVDCKTSCVIMRVGIGYRYFFRKTKRQSYNAAAAFAERLKGDDDCGKILI